MGITLFLARLIGLYLIIVGVGILLNLKYYQRVMGDFSKNSALLYMGGIMALFFGLLVVLFHNVWLVGWPVIITIMGWLGIVKGVVILVFPNAILRMTEAYRDKTSLLAVHIVIVIALGGYLTYMGYFTG